MSSVESWATLIAVPHDHPSLPGHFPDGPIVPGVLLLDLILQQIQKHGPCRLRSIPSSKFLQPVLPGECLDVRVEVSATDVSTRRARFAATRAGIAVLEGIFVLSTEASVTP